MNAYSKTVESLVRRDALRLKALQCVKQLQLPQCYLAAGFVRNLVWDYLHAKPRSTALNDVDVIYFDPLETNPDAHLAHEARLKHALPILNWQVRNQAWMHLRNGDRPYQSAIDAMSYWPEQETAVAVRLNSDNQFECVSVFGLASLFALRITYNPKRERALFEQRIQTKGWHNLWPELRVV
ncbi:nucleotidyltransferase family protein [Vibrio sp. V39_P1S14PM300]|uniref:nucleotidyltransferase family protein n=1 Tax=Vibrio sp. V39_P1S14PM300 TaxID=1938690 RepID=UPI00137277A2|nr:nucleotidyltransferase family protein [Vibrio sp. V39_P1S14PM300]NAX20507.1 nitrate reductase [Vibrio sp. V39_P1S14PM300]